MSRASLLLAAVLVGCSTPAERAAELAAQTKEARAWCDRMGIRITGVDCKGWGLAYVCGVAPEQGSPFRLHCGSHGRALPIPPSN